MARIRTIKPAFFRSKHVGNLPSVATRLTWIGLWTYVDDEGRGIDDPRLVKADLWPLDDSYTARKVEADLAAIADTGMICRYTAGHDPFFHVVNWREHQKINRPQPSQIPPCPTHGTGSEQYPPFTERSVIDHGTISEPSREEGNKEGNGMEGKGRERASAGNAAADHEPFDAFWESYPAHIGKPAAHKAWNRATREATADVVMAGLDVWVQHWRTENTPEKFIPHASTWLNQNRWDDTPPIQTRQLAVVKNTQSGGRAAIDEYRQRHNLGGTA